MHRAKKGAQVATSTHLAFEALVVAQILSGVEQRLVVEATVGAGKVVRTGVGKGRGMGGEGGRVWTRTAHVPPNLQPQQPIPTKPNQPTPLSQALACPNTLTSPSTLLPPYGALLAKPVSVGDGRNLFKALVLHPQPRLPGHFLLKLYQILKEKNCRGTRNSGGNHPPTTCLSTCRHGRHVAFCQKILGVSSHLRFSSDTEKSGE